jgi:hypothetical protein
MSVPQAKWNTGDLVGRLCHALGVAAKAIEHLGSDGYRDSEQPANNARPEKIVSETALLLLATTSGAISHPKIKARVEQIARMLIPYARSERILLAICLEPALALDYAHAHVCLSHLGYPDEEFDELLKQGLRAQAATGRERPPHRMLEQLWTEDLGPGSPSHSPGAIQQVAKRSLLNLPMDLLNGSRDDIYAFTHALLYFARFNGRSLRLPRPRSILHAEAEGALARCLDDEDYDLAGELLLTWPLTGKAWSPVATFGFFVLAQVEDAAGFLPAPSTRVDRLNSLQGDERLKYLLATSYHTVYVMGLLCAAALRPRRAPPLKVLTVRAARGFASKILPHLDIDERAVHWRGVLDTMKELERDAIAGFLLNVAIHRKFKKRDFNGLRSLLEIGHASNLTDSPVSSQAAEMLERIATLEGQHMERVFALAESQLAV